MVSSAYVSHHIAGRIRIRIPAARGDTEFLNKIRELAQVISGVERIECNQLTGSVLIHYAAGGYEYFEQWLAAAGDSAAAFSLVSDPRQLQDTAEESSAAPSRVPSDTANAIVDAFRELDGKVKSATDNAVDLKVLLPLAAATLGIFTIRTTIATPLWLTLMIFAFSAFLDLHPIESLKEDDRLTLASRRDYLN
jgi:hypothetical protein